MSIPFLTFSKFNLIGHEGQRGSATFCTVSKRKSPMHKHRTFMERVTRLVYIFLGKNIGSARSSPRRQHSTGVLHLIVRASRFSPTQQKRPMQMHRSSFYGAGDEARTRYLHLGKVALYRMSYTRNGHDALYHLIRKSQYLFSKFLKFFRILHMQSNPTHSPASARSHCRRIRPLHWHPADPHGTTGHPPGSDSSTRLRRFLYRK